MKITNLQIELKDSGTPALAETFMGYIQDAIQSVANRDDFTLGCSAITYDRLPNGYPADAEAIRIEPEIMLMPEPVVVDISIPMLASIIRVPVTRKMVDLANGDIDFGDIGMKPDFGTFVQEADDQTLCDYLLQVLCADSPKQVEEVWNMNITTLITLLNAALISRGIDPTFGANSPGLID